MDRPGQDKHHVRDSSGLGLTDADAVIDLPHMGALHLTSPAVGVAVNVEAASREVDKAEREAALLRGRRGT